MSVCPSIGAIPVLFLNTSDVGGVATGVTDISAQNFPMKRECYG